MSSPLVTIVIVTWNAASDIEECLSSIMDQSYSNYHVLIVDSNSSDSTLEIVRRKFPWVQVIASDENLGYRRGNRLGMRVAEGDYVVVCNDDVVVERDWLAEMVKALEDDPHVGMVTPRIVIYGQPTVMNFAGNTLHFSGLYGSRAKYAPVSRHLLSTDVAAAAGTCFMIRRELMIKAGGFSEDFDVPPRYWHAGYEDVDLGWHVQTLGYRIRYVASSVMYHKYNQPTRDNWDRFAGWTYSNLLYILRNFDVSALVLLAPIHLFMEIAWFVLAVLKGRKWAKAKVQAWWWFVVHRQDWLQMRRALCPLRRKSYWQLLPRTSPTIRVVSVTVSGPIGELGDVAINLVFWLYYQFLLLLSRVVLLHKSE